jgi:hypothetical protein
MSLISGGCKNIPSSLQHPNRLLGPLNLLSSGYCVLFILAVKWPEYETNHSPPPNAKVKNVYSYTSTLHGVVKKKKAIPVTGRGGPQGCETLRLPHFLDSQLTDGGEVVSLVRQPSFTPKKIPVTHLCYESESIPGHRAAGRIRSIEKSNDLIRNRNRDLPACSMVPQPTMLPCAPFHGVVLN